MAEASKKIKKSSASLKGGIIVAIAVVIVTYLIGGQLGWPDATRWTASLVIGVVMGGYVRVADL